MFNVIRYLLYITIILGILGPAFGSIKVGSIHLFPYRLFFLLIWALFVAQQLREYKIFILRIKMVRMYLLFLMSWLVYSTISVVWALDKKAAVKGDIFLLMNISIIFFIVYYFSNKDALWNLYRIWVLSAAFLLLIALWEIFTTSHIYSFQHQSRKNTHSSFILREVFRDSRREFISKLKIKRNFMPKTVFYNPNDFATFVALSIPFIFSWMKYTRYIIGKILLSVTLLISLYIILATYSRANYIAAILELILFFKTFPLRKRWKFFLYFIFICLLTFAIWPQAVKSLANLFIGQIISLISSRVSSDRSMFIRLNLIKNALLFLLETFGLGVGAGNVEYWMRNFAVYDTLGVLNVHNWWIEVLTNFGILVFTAYILFYISLIWNIYRVCICQINHWHDKVICEALLIALIGFSISSISSSSIMTFKPQWFLFAFALAFLNYVRQKTPMEEQ